MNNLLDKSTLNASMNQDELQYIYIGERTDKGLAEVEVDFLGTDEERAAELEKYGVNIVKMKKPYEGREFYGSNFKMYVLEKNFSSIKLGDLVEARATDLSEYGLDDPLLTVTLRDAQYEFALVVGDEADSANYYCMVPGKPHVFLIDKASLSDFFGVNPFDMTANFVALLNIDTVDGIELTSESGEYTFELIHTEKPPAEGETEPEKVTQVVVNDVQVQYAAFQTFYQSLIGLGTDTAIDEYTPEAEPVMTITYTLNDGSDDAIVRLYDYNNNFYAVQRDEYPIQFVLSKQEVKIMMETLDKLLAGKLDRQS
jgi:hypothetical protein